MSFEQFLELIFKTIEAICKILFRIGEFIFKFIYNLITGYEDAPAMKEHYDASFAREKDILRRKANGFSPNGRLNLSLEDSYKNALVVAQSGAGKSTTVLIPSIYTMIGNSLVIHDPSGELFAKSSQFLANNGYTVKVVNFADESKSDCYNPLARAHTYSDVLKCASLLVRNALGTNGGDQFWNNQAANYIALFCMIVKRLEPRFCHFASVKRLIDIGMAEPDKLDAFVARYAGEGELQEFKIFLNYEKKVLLNIQSTARAALTIFGDPSVAAITSFDSLNFEELRSERQAIFLMNKTSDMRYYSALVSMFAEQMFGYIMSRIPESYENPIFFLLDECSSLYLPTLQIALANVRKYSSGIMCVVQDFNQIKAMYGVHDAEAIKTNCYTKIFFAGLPLETCREISEMLGKREFERELEDGKTERRTRELLTANEVRELIPGYALIFTGANRALYSKMLPYYKQRKMLAFSKLPPLSPSPKHPYQSAQFLAL